MERFLGSAKGAACTTNKPGTASHRAPFCASSLKHELSHQLAGPRRCSQGRGVNRAESGDDQFSRSAGAIAAAGSLAGGRCLRADADSTHCRVIQVSPIEDIGELRPHGQADAFVQPEIPPYAKVLHRTPLAA